MRAIFHCPGQSSPSFPNYQLKKSLLSAFYSTFPGAFRCVPFVSKFFSVLFSQLWSKARIKQLFISSAVYKNNTARDAVVTLFLIAAQMNI